MDNEKKMADVIWADAIELNLIAWVAKESGTVSPPKFARALKVSYCQAESALANMAAKNLLQLLHEGGTVPVYRLTCAGYALIAEHRSRRSKLSRFFARRANDVLMKGLFEIDAILFMAKTEISTASPDVAKARAAIEEARDKILGLVRTSVEADQV
jgi:hypothetical protein